MFWQDCECTTIDGDAQALLNGVYGPPGGNNGGNGGCGCDYMACPQAPSVTTASGVSDPATTVNQGLWMVCGTSYTLPYVWNYYAKAWNAVQGQSVPNTSGVTSLVFPPACTVYFQSKQLVPWLNCVAPLK